MNRFGWVGLLFVLNLADALLTIYWVRNGFASEGNQLMASLLDLGDAPFLAVKVMVGATTAVVLARWGSLKLAQWGLMVALSIYLGLMGIHLVTGLAAFGFLSQTMVENFQVMMTSFC